MNKLSQLIEKKYYYVINFWGRVDLDFRKQAGPAYRCVIEIIHIFQNVSIQKKIIKIIQIIRQKIGNLEVNEKMTSIYNNETQKMIHKNDSQK